MHVWVFESILREVIFTATSKYLKIFVEKRKTLASAGLGKMPELERLAHRQGQNEYKHNEEMIA